MPTTTVGLPRYDLSSRRNRGARFMKILLMCHYFAPEVGAPQARLSETARRWAANGHDVQVLTGFPNHPDGIIRDGYQGRRRMEERLDGYRILRTWLYATPNSGFLKKTLGHLSWAASSFVLGRKLVSKPNVVVVSSPTFFSIASAWVYAKRFRVPFVLEVRDLWPGIFVELGVLTNRRIIQLLERLELAAYRAADLIVVVTEGFKDDLVSREVPAEKIEVITNGVDLEHFSPGPAKAELRKKLGADGDDRLVAYVGAHGISQGLGTLLDAAAELPADVKVALVGDGADKADLVARAEREGIDNVTFLDPVPKAEVPDLLRSADVLVAPLRDIPLFSTFIPSKIFEFLASGTPVIGALEGEAARILEQAGATVVPPENPAELAAAIEKVLADDNSDTADRGRRYVAEHYDRNLLADRYADRLQATIARS